MIYRRIRSVVTFSLFAKVFREVLPNPKRENQELIRTEAIYILLLFIRQDSSLHPDSPHRDTWHCKKWERWPSVRFSFFSCNIIILKNLKVFAEAAFGFLGYHFFRHIVLSNKGDLLGEGNHPWWLYYLDVGLAVLRGVLQVLQLHLGKV